MLEKYIESRACKIILNKLGVSNIKLTAVSNTGYPDRMFLVSGGKPVFIEFKTLKGVASKKQLYIKTMLEKKGYNVHIVSTIEEAVEIIKKASRNTEFKQRKASKTLDAT